MRKFFHTSILFKLHPESDDHSTQNLILVASKSNKNSFESTDGEIIPLLKNRYEKPLDLTVPVLTDDLAPVEYYNSFAQKSAQLDRNRLKNKLNSILKNIFTKKKANIAF